MKEKVDQLRREKNKMNKLTENSEKYRKNVQVIRSKNMEALVNCTTDVSKSIQRLAEMGIDISAISYRVALFDIDLYSGMYELDTEKQQESALMAFVLYNISDEIVTREEAGICISGREQSCRNPVSGKMEPQLSPKRQEKSVGKFRRRQKRLWDLTYLWESVNG